MEGLMLQTTDKKPIASKRTPETLDFADRLSLLGEHVLLIELAVEAACEDGDEEGGSAIVLGLRKLRAEIDELADMVLPPLPPEEQKRIEAIIRKRRP
jgi:hypothetical protein